MNKKVKKLINERKYDEASEIANIFLDNYELDEAEGSYNSVAVTDIKMHLLLSIVCGVLI